MSVRVQGTWEGVQFLVWSFALSNTTAAGVTFADDGRLAIVDRVTAVVGVTTAPAIVVVEMEADSEVFPLAVVVVDAATTVEVIGVVDDIKMEDVVAGLDEGEAALVATVEEVAAVSVAVTVDVVVDETETVWVVNVAAAVMLFVVGGAEVVVVIVLARGAVVNVGVSVLVVVVDVAVDVVVVVVVAGVTVVVSLGPAGLSLAETSWLVFFASLVVMVAPCSLSREVINLLSVSSATTILALFEATPVEAVAAGMVGAPEEIFLCFCSAEAFPSAV